MLYCSCQKFSRNCVFTKVKMENKKENMKLNGTHLISDNKQETVTSFYH